VVAAGLAAGQLLAVFAVWAQEDRGPRRARLIRASLGSISRPLFFFWTFLAKADGEALEPASWPLISLALVSVIEGGEDAPLDSSF